ncbi:MAG: MFS transporter [Alphaproteobacteria bacterium]|nr:MFS transporter [Alphaproteobacteria bacterium]
MKKLLWQTLADKLIVLTLLVSALGYFVDIFDLLLFSIVRVQSLKDLGVAEADLLTVGIQLLNAQMAGLLLGGLVWGVIGDKYGRVSVLFGSILFYSLGSIGNGLVTNVGQYALLRFISGLGLAGELGICVTLASELLPRGLRGLGTTFIATIGVLGATAAVLVADKVGWRDAYIIGGVLGLGLLVLRLKVRESALYLKMEKDKKDLKRGNLLMFFRRPDLLRRYIKVILIGAPIWAVVGIFITFTPEFAKDFGMTVLPNAGTAVFYCYIGLAFGDMCSGLLSQYFGSRRKSIAASLCLLIVFTGLFVTVRSDSLPVYYALCGLLGFSAGYWAMFVQVGAEQFGTNLRATAATSIPNVVRGLTIPMAAGFHALTPFLGVTGSGLAVAAAAVMLAFIALWKVRETFHANLDYLDL